MPQDTIIIDSPVGNLEISADDTGLIRVEFVTNNVTEESENPILIETKKQLDEFFSGQRKEFDLPLHIKGTAFQKQVWEVLKTIPYGGILSYQQVAERIQNPKAVRAVGQANKSNKFPIIIPCHRVIGKNKKLTGYAGKQVDKKEILLSLEKK
ncbi:methylated-DNA--[protein]-cysteine S-methyltransferase [Bacillus seohaeanensis]|uniref:Methylated-DNA--protein-cysteine methyltransferase n=1 Tax=Bacillus seohaeanensis TaxID=284580 RepID=A0ABW5RMB7_9BACI